MRPGAKQLRRVPALAKVANAVLEEIDLFSRVVRFERNAELFRQGTMPVILYFLLDGLVALSSSMPDGTAAVVDVIRPVWDLLIASIFAALPYLQTAHTVSEAELIAVEAPKLRALAEREPALGGALLRAIARDSRRTVRHVRDLKLRTSAQRLGAYLLDQLENRQAKRSEFRLPFEKGLLAAQLGCRQENLSRAFATLRGYGVETHGGQVILHDVAKLTAYAVPDFLGDPDLAGRGR